MGANNKHRKVLHRYAKAVLPFVLVTGFFTAGTNAGASCNTFPWVGSHWFYNSNHFVEGIPLWKNFTENKLICQVNHRTLATILTLLVTASSYRLVTLAHLTSPAKRSLVLLAALLWV